MTDNSGFANAVAMAVERQLEALPRRDIAGASWRDFGAIIELSSLAEAPVLADQIAARTSRNRNGRQRPAWPAKSPTRVRSFSVRTHRR